MIRFNPRLEVIGAVTVSLGLATFASPALADAETRLNFVSCPIVRDTSTVPCWLTKYEGELFYLGIQTDVSSEFQPPYLGHRVLVEAVVSDQPPICGGVVLKPLKISVMPELDPSCNDLLPAEHQYVIDFNPRPPGPSGGRLAFEQPSGDYAQPAAEKPGPDFLLTFDFDRSIEFRHPLALMKIVEYARANAATEIRVHGNRGAIRLSNGEVLIESENAGRQRAEDVSRLLRGVELPAPITTSWSEEPVEADGVDDWMSRSVSIEIR
jgi:hypothetical protein